MKLDKETLLKQKFWILLLVSLPLTLGAIFLLVTAVSGDIAATKKKVAGEYDKFYKLTGIKTPQDIAKARAEADAEKAMEKIVWEKAYEEQQDLFDWPKAVEDEFHFRDGLFAQKIKVYRGTMEPPADTKDDRFMSGKVVDKLGLRYIVIETKDKQRYKIYRSMRIPTISVEGDDKGVKEVSFDQIQIGDRVAVHFHRGKYFNEVLTDQELSAYRTDPDAYPNQIDPIIAQVEPMNEKGEGVVQLKSLSGIWWYEKGKLPPPRWPDPQQRFFTYVDGGWVSSSGDFSEEAWLAQEDLWIQKEIYRLIREANNSVSRFVGVGGEDPNKVYTFKNPYWEIGIKVPVGDELTMSFKNLQNRRQKLDVKFRIRFNKTGEPETIPFSKDAFGPRGTPEAERTEKIKLRDTLPRKGVYGLEQVLTWETAAVKRIDLISIGALSGDEYSHSHRTFPEDQKPLTKLDLPTGPTIQLPAGGAPQAGRGGVGRGKATKKAATDIGNIEFTKHKVIRNRYWEITPKILRRVPISLALIVDQDHVDRVLTAFGNSKLRFLTTQVSVNHYPSSVRPQLPLAADAQIGGTSRGPAFPAQYPGPGAPGSTGDLESNVEMVLYGGVTLYERYPPPLDVTK